MRDVSRSFAVRCALAASLCLGLSGCSCSDPLAAIKQQQARGAYADTVEPLRALLVARRGDAEVLYRYGLALTKTGQYDLAHWSLRRAMEDPEWAVPAGVELAFGMLHSTNWDEAIAAATAVLEADPENIEALLLRAMAKTTSNHDHEGAIADTDRIYEIDPDNMDAVQPRVLALLSLDRAEEAGEVIADLGRRLDETEVEQGTWAWHCATTAIFADESGEAELALQRWERCVERYPGVPNVAENAAEFYRARGDIQRVTDILRAAAAASPESRPFRIQLGEQLRFLGANDEAETLLREAAQALPPGRAAPAWTDLAKHLQEVGDFTGSARAMDRAVEGVRQVDLPWAQLLFDQADALVLAGEYDRALAVANQMDVAAHAEMIRARVAQERGQFRLALEHFDEAFRLWPDNVWAHYYAALAAEAIGDFDRAIESYRAAIRIGPGATDARVRAARVLIAHGRLTEAFAVLRFKQDVSPLEREGELLSIYLWARGGHDGALDAAMSAFASERAPHLAEAVAAAARGTRDRDGPAPAVERLRSWDAKELIDLSDPQQAEALRALVRYAHEAGALPKAEAAVRAAVGSHPKSAVLHEIQGWSRELGDAPAEQVRAAYDRALELDPQNARALAGLGRLSVPDDLNAAIGYFDRAIAADPADAEHPRQAAAALLESGRVEEAEARLDALLVEHPTDAESAQTLARLRSSRGDSSDRTLELAQRAARMGRGPDALDLVSRIHEQRNEPELASRAAERAQKMRERLGS